MRVEWPSGLVQERHGVDLVARFHTRDAGLDTEHAEACLTGKLVGGTPFEGCDAIMTVPAGRH